MSLYTVYPPQKDAPAPVHVRAYETAQQLLCHGNYCKPILSPVRASFQQPSAVRPWPDELLRLPKHHQLQAAVCRPPRYWPDELRRPPKYPRQGSAAETISAQTRPKFTPAHDSVAAAVSHKHHSIIRVGAGLLQFVHACTCTSIAEAIPIKNLFLPFSPASFFQMTPAASALSWPASTSRPHLPVSKHPQGRRQWWEPPLQMRPQSVH